MPDREPRRPRLIGRTARRRRGTRTFVTYWVTNFGRGHALQGGDDLELAGGFAGEVDHAITLGVAQGVQRGFEQDAGFAKAGRRFEGDEALGDEGGFEQRAGV